MKQTDTFAEKLSKLAKFKKEFGHTNVPRTHHDQDLAHWVRNVRAAWRAGKLEAAQLEKLTKADFSFEPKDTAWQAHYDNLVDYVRIHGNAKVPRDYKDHTLAVWVMHQRDHMKLNLLDEAQVGLLKKINFIFEPQEFQWEENLQRLKDFKKAFGHVLVPRRYEDAKLANFAAEMRKRFKAGTLAEDQVQDLVKLGFVFDALEEAWSEKLAEYTQWRKKNKDVPMPPRRIDGKGNPLHDWCRVQTGNLQAGKMPAERISRLKSAGFPVT